MVDWPSALWGVIANSAPPRAAAIIVGRTFMSRFLRIWAGLRPLLPANCTELSLETMVPPPPSGMQFRMWLANTPEGRARALVTPTSFAIDQAAPIRGP